ncbi:DNA-binding transcriptional regulator, LysR family [Alteribacillus persepolensis]|uniref:DNA-binding transcriptional regulator, LysR family n=1 Tax=Alteribacillus persepolensis TaxID=568899 RepID=A0A1G8EJ50_9BACI|nr:LysR family transcriptional regulator [Alteribacillus persepolensis]SDH69856.1 DNA-binding transcriptional regulator, LysR family [Alteribacillus persepolensis]
MDIVQLQNFIVVAEEENMTKAADLLMLSQSALSRSILSLEKEIGVPLFDRKNRKIILNRYGKTFLKDAKHLVQYWDHSKLRLKEMVEPSLGNVSTSFVHSLGITYIPSILKKFKEQFPDYTLSLQEEKAPNIIKELLTNDIDFGFGTQYKTFAELEYTTLFRDKIVLIASNHHDFCKEREPITLEMLEKEPFIQYPAGTELKKLVETTIASHHKTLNIIYEGLEINSVIGLVKANEGVAFVPESIVPTINGIHLVPVTGLNIERPVYLIHKKKGYLSKAALQFKDFVLKHHCLY